MLDLQRLIAEEAKKGYLGENATAKICQDIILKALAEGMLSRNVTIKGGVVMRSKTGNIRRATQDLDIDFIKYSLADDAINTFIRKLNCLDGIKIRKYGEIEELRQQDYSGKRVNIVIGDLEGNQLKTKLDLGVHNRLELEQEEYCFDIAYGENGASLLINSNEQMFSEKLRSLLKFGPFSTRYKDIFDMFYLLKYMKNDKLINALDVYIFDDMKMREKNIDDVVKRLEMTFQDDEYVAALSTTDKKWIDEEVETVLDEIKKYIGKL